MSGEKKSATATRQALDAATNAMPETIPDVNSEEYRLLYLPTMATVYLARHQEKPPSDEFLTAHVFGADCQVGCDLCREETEFLVAHQKQFS